MSFMKGLVLLLLLQSASSFLFNVEEPLVIGSFNIQSFGPTKVARPEFVSTVIRILSRYDIVLIQEIKDSSSENEVFQIVIDALNEHVKGNGVKYDFSISPRLGKTTYKEQKAYLYKNSLYENDGSTRIKLINDYVYNDIEGIYDRPPYVAHFQIENTEFPVKSFSMINLHLKPSNVLNESLALRPVINDIKDKYNENIIIMGDMNFDCRYMSSAKKQMVRDELSEFTFYINDDVSTTTSSALCALDRILISGETFKTSVVQESNSTYLYYKEFDMTLEEADKISDHFPVEIKFNKPVERVVTTKKPYDNKEPSLVIGSFNIQSLGPTKMARPEFVSAVVEILSKYDIILIQEIKDSSSENEVFQSLIDSLNNYVSKHNVKYDFDISPRLGRGTYKEQAAYLYKNSFDGSSSRRIKITNDYVYNDVNSVYDRPPYVAKFVIENTDLPVSEFTMLNLHLRPSSVLNESLALRDVVNEISDKNIMILGDMNFDCKYASNAKRETVRNELSEYTFYINDDQSTTTSTSLCAYDRILITGVIQNQIVPDSNRTYVYYPDMGLTHEEADDISDHFPVEIKFDN